MDIFFSIVVFAIITSVWVQAGASARKSGGTENLWAPARSNKKFVPLNQREVNRQFALQKAKPFLKKYTEFMGEHCLANENCKVNLIIEGKNKKIVCISKKATREGKIKILTANVNIDFEDMYNYTLDYVVDSIWDTLCTNFSAITVYENIYEALTVALLEVQESELPMPKGTKTQKVYDSVSNTQIRTNNLLNINTATEAELLALPGVNIVIAKKAIKYIERTGGFKSVNEFIEKMKVKDIFVDQIKNLACVNLDDTTEESSSQKTNEQQNTGGLDIIDSNFTPHSDSERIIDL